MTQSMLLAMNHFGVDRGCIGMAMFLQADGGRFSVRATPEFRQQLGQGLPTDFILV
jgi:hypothetical protein